MAALDLIGPNGIVCLIGVANEGTLHIGTDLARGLVLENQTIFGSVNANRRHYAEAARVLAEADPSWLSRLVNRRVPLERWEEAYRPEPRDVKTVIEFLPPDGAS
jgi:threonine dehydrogenase-like Zn-dependent dehydrogenase